MYKHILVPTDGSPLSLKAAKTAANLAKALGARITTLYVIPPYPPPPSNDGMLYVEYFSPREYAKQTQKHAGAALAKVEAAARAAGVPCVSLYLTGEEPWQSIIETARSSKCDLIAMASSAAEGGAESALFRSRYEISTTRFASKRGFSLTPSFAYPRGLHTTRVALSR